MRYCCDVLKEFLSTPSARRATRRSTVCVVRETISIHALRDEGDRRQQKRHTMQRTFLSTPSARRATRNLRFFAAYSPISIHALREEGDHTEPLRNPCRTYFYPRPPRGGRLCVPSSGGVPAIISIHALREEGDNRLSVHQLCIHDFYPRPPRGGRPVLRARCTGCAYFYPRPPRGGRRLHVVASQVFLAISIHALREEGDAGSGLFVLCRAEQFLSTPSARRATCANHSKNGISFISIHALREEGDQSTFRRFSQ